MNKMLQSTAAVLLSGSLMTAPVLAANTPVFTDVPSTDWSYSFVTRAASESLVSGMGDGTFGGNRKLSCAQFVTMICNLLYRSEVDTYQATYKPAEWWRSFMAVAYSKGLLTNTVAGDSRTESKQWKTSVVEAEISRYDMAQVMVNVMTAQKWQGVSEQELTQVQSKIADWAQIPAKYRTAVSTAYAKNFLSGMDQKGTFSGAESMTRAHGAVVICKLLDESQKEQQKEEEEEKTEKPAFSNTTNLVNGQEPTQTNVYNAVQALKKAYPTGYIWNLTNRYQSPVMGTSTGREAMISMLADQIFGNLAVKTTTKLDEVKPGDVIALGNGSFLLVEDVEDDTILYMTCSSTGKVTWGNEAEMDALTDVKAIYTRYDDTERREDDTVLGEGTLSNGKAVTTKNVKELVKKFLRTEYSEGDSWDERKGYSFPAFSNRHVYGNQAFAYYMNDYIFGDLEVFELNDFDDLRVGDIVYHDAWDEYLVITAVDGDDIDYISVFNGQVYEDDMDVDDFSSADTAYSRYPDAKQKELLSDGKEVTASNVNALIKQFIAQEYKVNDTWKDSTSYKAPAFTSSRVYGNQAFAYRLSDYIFGDLKVYQLSDFDDLQLGDVFYCDDWEEYVVVTGINGDEITYLGVYNEKVYSNTVDVDDLGSGDRAYSRYPVAKKAATLSNGKSASTRNVRSLIEQFIAQEYPIGTAWSKTYQSDTFSNRTAYEDQAFAYYLSDYIFGKLNAWEVKDFKSLREGDVLYYSGWEEYLVVTSVSGSKLEVIGINTAQKVYQDELSLSDLGSRDYAYSRYPA